MNHFDHAESDVELKLPTEVNALFILSKKAQLIDKTYRSVPRYIFSFFRCDDFRLIRKHPFCIIIPNWKLCILDSRKGG
ncbi:hypothetical protein CHCC20335_3407 [Bacillus paralicheniformis]|nr:hypothetical protein CHCC20335_3407 [Bacillus paralicheniformis]